MSAPRRKAPADPHKCSGCGPANLFATVAPELLLHGLALIPLGGEDGKEPLIQFGRWRRPPGRKAIVEFASKFPDANPGIVTGLSRVTIVDPDDPDLVDPMVRRFGTTPLITGTPRGGVHLWYRSNGEGCPDLREAEGLAVDIKGIGGIAVIPPAVAWNGPGAGKAYRFIKGSWADLPHLPQIIPGSLPARPTATVTHLRGVRYGLRNGTLLKLLLRQVGYCDSETDLLDVATTIVEQTFELEGVPPFTAAEIAKTVESVWKIQQEGRNWVGKEAQLIVPASEFAVLQENPDALTLRMTLRWAHGARVEPFAIVCKAMARDEAITGWTDFKRYMRARDWLLEHGFLIEHHRGGSKIGDASLYRLAEPKGTDSVPLRWDERKRAAHKGPDSVPYRSRHPAPLDRAPLVGSFVGPAGNPTKRQQPKTAVPPKTRAPKGNRREKAEWLRDHLDAGVVTRDAVGSVLEIQPAHVDEIANGRSELGAGAWRKLAALVAERLH
jgi:hypothetical protein